MRARLNSCDPNRLQLLAEDFVEHDPFVEMIVSGENRRGAPGSRGTNTNEEKERGKRPDYLVEDEETWTPERNVAPRVIE